jgi:hypothetical protein
LPVEKSWNKLGGGQTILRAPFYPQKQLFPVSSTTVSNSIDVDVLPRWVIGVVLNYYFPPWFCHDVAPTTVCVLRWYPKHGEIEKGKIADWSGIKQPLRALPAPLFVTTNPFQKLYELHNSSGVAMALRDPSAP